MEHIVKLLEAHIESCDKTNAKISADLEKVKDNHLVHVQDALNEIGVSVQGIKTDVDWLKRVFWIIATATIASLIGTFFSLIVDKR